VGTCRLFIRLLLTISMIASFLIVPAVSAQGSELLRGTWTLAVPTPEPGIERGYTAADDLWKWSSRRDRTTIQTVQIVSALSFDENRSIQPIQKWDSSDGGHNSFSMQLDWYVPDMDSDSSAMLTSLSGKAEGHVQLSYLTSENERSIVKLTWRGTVEGNGECTGGECAMLLDISGRMSDADGRRNCGDFALRTGSVIDPNKQSWTFTDISSDIPSEVVTNLRTSNDDVSCFIGETEKNLTTGKVWFYYGPEQIGDRLTSYSLGTPDAMRIGGRTINDPVRVMPGDNVRIEYRAVQAQLHEQRFRNVSLLWDPKHEPLQMEQDLRLDLQFSGRSNDELRLKGDIRGVVVLDQDLETEPIRLAEFEGTLSGNGTKDPGTGIYNIRISGDLILNGKEGLSSCGTMQLNMSATLQYHRYPDLTFLPNGAGDITVVNDSRCFLETLEDIGDT
jgi:hypothetical protein